MVQTKSAPRYSVHSKPHWPNTFQTYVNNADEGGTTANGLEVDTRWYALPLRTQPSLHDIDINCASSRFDGS